MTSSPLVPSIETVSALASPELPPSVPARSILTCVVAVPVRSWTCDRVGAAEHAEIEGLHLYCVRDVAWRRGERGVSPPLFDRMLVVGARAGVGEGVGVAPLALEHIVAVAPSCRGTGRCRPFFLFFFFLAPIRVSIFPRLLMIVSLPVPPSRERAAYVLSEQLRSRRGCHGRQSHR